MKTITTITILTVAAIHILISVVEMFLWENPLVHQRLGFTADLANQVTPIVQNAGLYNSFIAAGLVWAAFAKNNTVRLRVFFLVCVIIAGIFGALTLKWTTLVLQTVPGFVALFFVWFTRSQFKLQV
jgi:putative membrane protein